MSKELSVTLSPDSEQAFRQAVAYMERTTTHSAPRILELAGVGYAVSARKATPRARKGKKRDIVRLGKGRYGVIVRSQRRRARMVPISAGTITEVKALDIAAVPNVGAAQGSWNGVMRALGKTVTDSGPKVGDARKFGGVLTPAIEITNRLSYLLKVAPSVDAIAKQKAASSMIRRTDAILARSWK